MANKSNRGKENIVTDKNISIRHYSTVGLNVVSISLTKDTDDIAYTKKYYNADKQNLVSTFLLTKHADDWIAYLKILL